MAAITRGNRIEIVPSSILPGPREDMSAMKRVCRRRELPETTLTAPFCSLPNIQGEFSIQRAYRDSKSHPKQALSDD